MRTSLVLIVLALAALAAAAGPASAAEQKTACQKLKTNGKDLAPAHRVKLVRRRNDEDGTNLRGCVLPDGKVRTVAASSHYFTSDDDYSVRQVNGPVVLVDTSGVNQYVSTTSTYVFNIRNGRSYTLASTCSGFACGPPPGETAERAFVNAKGQAAAAIVENGAVEITGFNSKGERTVLDSGSTEEIPPSSLRLKSGTVSWTHSGQPRSSDL